MIFTLLSLPIKPPARIRFFGGGGTKEIRWCAEFLLTITYYFLPLESVDAAMESWPKNVTNI